MHMHIYIYTIRSEVGIAYILGAMGNWKASHPKPRLLDSLAELLPPPEELQATAGSSLALQELNPFPLILNTPNPLMMNIAPKYGLSYISGVFVIRSRGCYSMGEEINQRCQNWDFTKKMGLLGMIA